MISTSLTQFGDVNIYNPILPSPWGDNIICLRISFAIFVRALMQHRLEASDVCDTWGDHTSQDGIADKRNSSDTETETHLGLPGHRMSKAVSRGLVVSFQLVSQALLVVSQTAPPPAGGGALHPSSLFRAPLQLQKDHDHHQMRH